MAKVYVSSTIVDLEAEREAHQLSDFRSSSDQGTGRWVRAPRSGADGLGESSLKHQEHGQQQAERGNH
jgi:hypothetical protein